MWKFLLLLSLAFAAAQSQEVTLECDFGIFVGYSCILLEVEVTDPEATIVITGEHNENMTNEDVLSIVILNSNTPFTIQELFTAFPNVVFFEVINSNLQSIRIPPSAILWEIYLQGNNISVIEADSLRNQTGLEYLYLHNNQIQAIEDGAFDDLNMLRSLDLYYNQLSELTANTLRGLTNVYYLDLENNQFTRIEEGVFANNRGIGAIYLERNQISAISPTFIEELRGSPLQFVGLTGNECAQRFVSIDPEFGWATLATVLQPCFNNFIGLEPGDSRATSVHYTGSITIFDQFGNELISL